MAAKKKVIVIGGGPGGYATALYSAHLGNQVTLVEKQLLGGTCLNAGCIPTKVFVQAANVYAVAKEAAALGINIAGPLTVDFARTTKFKNSVVARLRGGVGYLLKAAGVNVVQGTGRITSWDTVEIAANKETRIETADAVVIATGSSEIALPGFETDGVRVLNSTQLLDVQRLPESIAIIGGGVIGVEFASILRRLGKEVTIVEFCPRILPSEDVRVSEALRSALEKQGVKIFTGALADRIISKDGGEVTFSVCLKDGSTRQIAVEQILVSIGRKANLENIGLEEANISFGKSIATDERMQTSVPGIYAVGDVTSSLQLAHVAYHEALVTSLNIAGQSAAADYHAVPCCIFSHPEVARVGLTEQEAREKLANVQVKVESFNGNGKAMIEQETDGFVKLVYDGDTTRVVGCSIIGPKATELIAEPSLAVRLDLPIRKLAENINAHPSLSEMLGETAAAAIGLNLHTA